MRFVVGSTSEIPPGERKIVTVAGRSIGVFNVDGQFYAIRNRCPHQGAPLCEGKLWGVLKSDVPGSFQYDGTKEIIACISHGWEFSVKTGQSWCDPQRLRVRRYNVELEEGKSLAAETGQAAPEASAEPAAPDPEAPAPGMVKGPYVVETYSVAVEDDLIYVVVDVVDAGSGPTRRA
jgi:3-phenylpropionate/trans-cinnamate dioxygenase ferredoxin subunit